MKTDFIVIQIGSSNITIFNGMDDADVVTIFSNLIDNAIEANNKVSGKRYIKMQESDLGNSGLFVMRNPTEEKLCREGDNIFSSKESDNRSVIGTGTGNIKAIARKYGMQCSFETEDNEFVFELWSE